MSRGTDAAGLEEIFSPTVKEFDTKTIMRDQDASPNIPTSPQAEVLYPGELTLKNLNCIYVPDEETAAKVESICTACDRDMVDCRVSKELFTR